MRSHCALVAAISAFVTVFSAPAIFAHDETIEIRLNGRTSKTYTYTQLDLLAQAYPHTGNEGRRGVALLDLAPLLIDCVRLEATGTEVGVWVDPVNGDYSSLAEAFHEIILTQSGSSWAIEYDGTRVESVRRIDLAGDLLADTNLEVWISWEGVRELASRLGEFADRHDLSIEIVEVANIRSKLLTVYRAGGRMPDLVMVQSDYLPEFLALRLLQPIDPVIDRTHGLAGLEAFRNGGRVWALPFYFDTQLVYYHPDLVSPPTDRNWNLEEFEETLVSLKQDHDAPAIWNAYSAYWLTPFLFGFGRVQIADLEGRVTIADPATAEAVGYLLRLYREGLVVPLERDAMFGKFLRGETGLVLSGSYSIPMLERIGVLYRIAQLPAELEPINDFKGFAITAKSRHPLLARRLVQHLASVALQSAFCLESSKLPARTAAFAIERDGESDDRALYSATSRGVAIPPVAGYTVYKNTMWQLLRLIFAGELSVDDALTAGELIIQGETE